MSSAVPSAILVSMMEDLGLGRVEELPMEDGERARGGACRGNFFGGGRGRGDFGRAARESVQAVSVTKADGPTNAWQAAIASNAFDDDDAAEVKGLDTLGGGNLYRMRNASNSQDTAPVASFSKSRGEIAPGMPAPRRNPVRLSRPTITGFSDKPVPVDMPVRHFPPGYAKSPVNDKPGNSKSGDLVRKKTEENDQPKQKMSSSVRVQPALSLKPPQESNQPTKPKIQIRRPDSATVVIEDDIKVALKDYKTFYQGHAYISKPPAPATAFITILLETDEMDDVEYTVSQWKDCLHMGKCFVGRFEASPGQAAAHCLEFSTIAAMARFTKEYTRLLNEHNGKTTPEPLKGFEARTSLTTPDIDGQTVRTSEETQVSAQAGKSSTEVPKVDSTSTISTLPGKAPEKPKQEDVSSIFQKAWQKNQALSHKEQKSVADDKKLVPGKGAAHDTPVSCETKLQDETVQIRDDPERINQPDPERPGEKTLLISAKENEISVNLPQKETVTSHLERSADITAKNNGADDSSDDDEETLRECLLRLREKVAALANARGLDTADHLDGIFRNAVEAFVAQTSDYYNELDEDGKKGIVQAYYDLAVKPKKVLRRTYSREQLVELQDAAQLPSESRMLFVPPRVASKTSGSHEGRTRTPSGSPSLGNSVRAAAISTPLSDDVRQPRSNGPTIQDQIKKVAGNATWAFASQDASRAPSNQSKDKRDSLKQTDTEKPAEITKSTGLSGSRWASLETPASNAELANPLIPGLDGACDEISKFSNHHTSKETGGALNDLAGINMNIIVLGNTADLDGLIIGGSTTKHEYHAGKKVEFSSDLKIDTSIEHKEEPKASVPTSASSLGGIESAFQKMSLLD